MRNWVTGTTTNMEIYNVKSMLNSYRLTAVLITAMGMSASLQAQEIAVAVKAGTLGFGVEVVTPLATNLNGRAGFNYFSLDNSNELTDIDYDIDLTLQTFTALLDWHPLGNGFRLSGGAFYNGNQADVKSTTTGSVEIGNQTFVIGPNDRVTGDVDFNKFAPYLGLGWGSYFGKKSHLTVSFDLGVMFQGSGNLDLQAEGPLSAAPGVSAALSQEEREAEDEIEDYKYYPVISLGLAYHF